MNRIIYLVPALFISMSGMAQSNGSSVAKSNIKDSVQAPAYYLPMHALNDSLAINQLLMQLAGKIKDDFEKRSRPSDPEKIADYFDTAARIQLIAGEFERSIQLLDSMRRYNTYDSGNRAFGIDYESYALTRNTQGYSAANFSTLYLQEFKQVYIRLGSFREKIFADYFFDSARLKSDSTAFHKCLEAQKSRHSDTISYKDAKTILFQYADLIVANATLPLARPWLNAAPDHVLYPIIRESGAGVIPVKNIDAYPDPNTRYKLLIELTSGIKNKTDSETINSINWGIIEVGRKINLHLIAGVKKQDLDVVMLIHGPVLYSFYNNETYRKKYNVDNPNIAIIKQLQAAGVTVVACGQAMFGFNVKKEEMVPGVQVALSAQTELSTYQLKNYVYYSLTEGK